MPGESGLESAAPPQCQTSLSCAEPPQASGSRMLGKRPGPQQQDSGGQRSVQHMESKCITDGPAWAPLTGEGRVW